MAIYHVMQVFPGDYYAPKRWKTSDGLMPHRVVWERFAAIGIVAAREKLTWAGAIRFALSSENSDDTEQRLLREAFPT